MSEIITYGDPLYDRIMREWIANKRPASVQVGSVIYRDLGDGQSFIALYRVGEFESLYASQSIGARQSSDAINPDGTPRGFKSE